MRHSPGVSGFREWDEGNRPDYVVVGRSGCGGSEAVEWLGDRRRRGGQIAFGISVGVLCVFLLCILSWPLLWLIQYVCSMGFTPRRTCGLVFAVAGGLLVIGFLSWAVGKPKEKEAEQDSPGNGSQPIR
jgi:hypothetical protein